MFAVADFCGFPGRYAEGFSVWEWNGVGSSTDRPLLSRLSTPVRRDHEPTGLLNLAVLPSPPVDPPSPDGAARLQIEELERRISKDKIRFAVGTPQGRFSSVWSAWGQGLGQRATYYVSPPTFVYSTTLRRVVYSTKISLHGGGHWQWALTKEHFEELKVQGLPQPDDRRFVKWNGPVAPDIGAFHALSIAIPTDYLHSDAPKSTRAKPILIFEAAPPGMAIEVGFFFAREHEATLEPKFLVMGKPIFRTRLDSGEDVWMVLRVRDFDPNAIPSAERFNAASQRLLDLNALPEPGGQLDNQVSLLWDRPKEGEALVLAEVGGLAVRRNP